MVNQYLWIGISIGVFVAGIGYGVLQSTYQPQRMMSVQQMQHMMNLMNGTMMGSNMTHNQMMHP